MPLLPVLHHKQHQQSDCLAACAAMIMEYLHLPISYSRLLTLLKVRSFGTAFSNLHNLGTVFDLSITIRNGDLQLLRKWLAIGLPPIVALNTIDLPQWNGEETDHAVVVVGIDEVHIYVNDPEFDHAPQTIELTHFELAWQHQDYLCAVIGLDKIS